MSRPNHVLHDSPNFHTGHPGFLGEPREDIGLSIEGSLSAILMYMSRELGTATVTCVVNPPSGVYRILQGRW